MKFAIFLISLLCVSCSSNLSIRHDSAASDIEKANRLFTKKASIIVYKNKTEEKGMVQRISRDSIYTSVTAFPVTDISEIVVVKKGGGIFLGMIVGAAPGLLIGSLGNDNSEGINPVPLLSRILLVAGVAAGGVAGAMIEVKDHLRFD